MFSIYIKSVNCNFYNEIINLQTFTSPQINVIKQLRESFLIECYKQALEKNNMKFDGSI